MQDTPDPLAEPAPTDWPRRVAVEIVEHQWNHGILVTRVPDWDKGGTVGLNQEDVPREVWDQPVGAIVHAVLYERDELEPDEPTWPEFRDWEWPGGSETEDTYRLAALQAAWAAWAAAQQEHRR